MFVETEKRPQGEPHKVGTLTLSEAIRVGAKLRPQAREVLFEHGKTCAIGAAAEARGWKPADEFLASRVVDEFVPELSGGTMHKKETLFYAIGSRNDAGETREAIADWLESQGY